MILRQVICLNKLENETDFEYKIRLCKLKLNKEIDLDWSEIVSMLNLDIHPDSLRKMAYGYVEYDNYINNINTATTTILSISDLHVPFQLPKEKLVNFVGRVDILQINGDVLDFAACSKFLKTHRPSNIEELVIARQYIIDLINYIKPKKLVINDGNHDIRLGTYLASHLDSDVQEMLPESGLACIINDGFTHYDRKTGIVTKYKPLIDVVDIEIEYTNTWYSVIGDAIFAHPKTYSSAPLKTAEKAMYWFRNEGLNFNHMILGHTHRLGQYQIGTTTIYEQGAFCHTEKMKYTDGLLVNSQKQGFVVLYQDINGNTIKNKTRLISLN